MHYITIKSDLGIQRIETRDILIGRSLWSISLQVALFTMKTEYCLMEDKNIREIYLQAEVYNQPSKRFSRPIGITRS